jgi:uncharacterized membrane protein YhhN
MKPAILAYIYLAVAAIEVFAEATQHDMLRFIFKPLLMIILIAFYIKSMEGGWNKIHKIMVAAFAFSWVGDVALMFVRYNENFFLVGLVGFLITHVLYIVAFMDVTDKQTAPFLKTTPLILIPFVLYFAGLLYYVFPAVPGDFKIPVAVYSATIAAMVISAVNRKGRVNATSFAYVMAGGLMFMLSDSIIAINKFKAPFSTAGIFIMILYIAGQYAIAQGMLKQFDKTKA